MRFRRYKAFILYIKAVSLGSFAAFGDYVEVLGRKISEYAGKMGLFLEEGL